jgi:hypothetical protein
VFPHFPLAVMLFALRISIFFMRLPRVELLLGKNTFKIFLKRDFTIQTLV